MTVVASLPLSHEDDATQLPDVEAGRQTAAWGEVRMIERSIDLYHTDSEDESPLSLSL